MNDLFKTGDPRMDFVVGNYTKVVDFEECLKYTKDNFCNALLRKLKNLLEEWGYDEPKIEKDSRGEFVWWAIPGFYHKADDVGLYYAIEIGNGWDTLIGESDYPVFLNLVSDRAEGRTRRSHQINSWIDGSYRILRDNGNYLTRKGIKVVSGQNEWENGLAAIFLKEELSINSLSSIPFEGVKVRLKGKVKSFVDNLTGERTLIRPFFEVE